MPWSIPKPCLTCRKPTRAGSRCDEHRREYERERSRNRPKTAARGLGGEWQRKSKQARAETPFCAVCGSEQDLTLDHKVPRARGGTGADENLGDVLCRSCNSAKGAR